jgi:hypothetical protein
MGSELSPSLPQELRNLDHSIATWGGIFMSDCLLTPPERLPVERVAIINIRILQKID